MYNDVLELKFMVDSVQWLGVFARRKKKAGNVHMEEESAVLSNWNGQDAQASAAH